MSDDQWKYIGDGVYAMFDGFHLVLRTQRNGEWQTIYLEPAVWQELMKLIGIK